MAIKKFKYVMKGPHKGKDFSSRSIPRFKFTKGEMEIMADTGDLLTMDRVLADYGAYREDDKPKDAADAKKTKKAEEAEDAKKAKTNGGNVSPAGKISRGPYGSSQQNAGTNDRQTGGQTFKPNSNSSTDTGNGEALI